MSEQVSQSNCKVISQIESQITRITKESELRGNITMANYEFPDNDEEKDEDYVPEDLSEPEEEYYQDSECDFVEDIIDIETLLSECDKELDDLFDEFEFDEELDSDFDESAYLPVLNELISVLKNN